MKYYEGSAVFPDKCSSTVSSMVTLGIGCHGLYFQAANHPQEDRVRVSMLLGLTNVHSLLVVRYLNSDLSFLFSYSHEYYLGYKLIIIFALSLEIKRSIIPRSHLFIFLWSL